MDARTATRRSVQLLIAVVVVSLLAGQVLGQPILLSFVTTESMEPTIDAGDGFIAVPPELAGDVGEGDVVVYEAEEIQGGGLTTHRVVDETEDGYVTKGDGNPFTDQDNDEPPVKEGQIVAVAWQPGGDVLTVPSVGVVVNGLQSVLSGVQQTLANLLGTRALLGTQGIAYLLFGASIVLYLVAGRFEDDSQRERSRDRETGLSGRTVALAFTLLVVGGVTAAMVVPAGSQEFGIISAEFESESPDVIQQGTNESYPYEVPNNGVVPTIVYLEAESDNIAAEPDRLRLEGRSAANTTVTISAPPDTGRYRTYVQERRYLHLLPRPVIDSLYRVHPWLPILAIDLLVGVPAYLLALFLVGTGRLRSRPGGRSSRSMTR